MKKLFTVIVFAGAVIVCQARQTQTVMLNGMQEPTPNFDYYSYGTRSSAQFSLTGSTLTISSGNFMNLWGNPIQVAVWDGTAGSVGTELFALSESASPEGGGLYNGTFNGSQALTTGQVNAFYSDDLYINITTTTQNSPQGEVRGQLMPVPEPATMTLMTVASVAWLAKRRKKA